MYETGVCGTTNWEEPCTRGFGCTGILQFRAKTKKGAKKKEKLSPTRLHMHKLSLDRAMKDVQGGGLWVK